jgi:type I restriction enzyme S subunit
VSNVIRHKVRLSEICQIQPSKNEVRLRLKDSDAVTFAPMETLGIRRKHLFRTTERLLSEVAGSYTYFANNDVLLAKITPCFENGKLGIASGLINGAGFGSSEYIVLRPSEVLTSDYLYYFLSQDTFRAAGEKNMTGTAGQKRITKSYLESCTIPIPSIGEQKRVVTVLDQAFGEIAVACSKVQQSIDGAQSLFVHALTALTSPLGATWVHSKLGLETRFIDYRGRTPQKTTSGLRLITAKNVRMGYVKDDPQEFVAPASYDDWMTRGIPQKGDVLFTTEAPLANVAQLDTDERVVFAQRIIVLQTDSDRLDPSFLKFLLLSSPIQKLIHEKGTGATATGIKASLLKTIPISFPSSIRKQKELAENLNDLSRQVDELISVYEAKLSALQALRQSLLHQAFSGQLLQKNPQAVVIPFPVTLPSISSTDLHVGVLALAYAAHETLHRASDFGHVKAEKIAHMVEAYMGVDLGRTPVRDAAGPNDFPHLKKVEHRADKAGYLTFARQPSGAYRVTKKAGFDSLVTKTRTALGDRNQDLDKLLNLMTPMTTKQAEIFATVYAAWNNLLIDGEPITDERIVHAAREDWHSDKLNIPRDKFFTAIEWIRTKGLCPEGKGKRVEAKKH